MTYKVGLTGQVEGFGCQIYDDTAMPRITVWARLGDDKDRPVETNAEVESEAARIAGLLNTPKISTLQAEHDDLLNLVETFVNSYERGAAPPLSWLMYDAKAMITKFRK